MECDFGCNGIDECATTLLTVGAAKLGLGFSPITLVCAFSMFIWGLVVMNRAEASSGFTKLLLLPQLLVVLPATLAEVAANLAET